MTEEQKAAVEEKLEMAQYFGENPDSPLKAMVEQAIEDGVAPAIAFACCCRGSHQQQRGDGG